MVEYLGLGHHHGASRLRGRSTHIISRANLMILPWQMVPVRSKEDLVRYHAAQSDRNTARMLRWVGLYPAAGVDTNTTIKLEQGYLGGMIQREFIFKGRSSSGGPVTLDSSSSSSELGTMPALVVGSKGINNG